MLPKLTREGLFDRNTLYSPIVHRIHGYCYCFPVLLLFTVYTLTVDCYTVPLLSLYRRSIIGYMSIDCFNWIK